MTLKIKRTGASEYGQYIKALITGDPGAGKTLISSTFPNPLFASAEGGLMSLAQRNIPYIDVKSSTDLLAIKASLQQPVSVQKEILGMEIETIVIDTIDEVQKMLIRERLKDTHKDSMELRDWGWLGEQMQLIISEFRNLDMNVVMTCHLREQSDGDSGAVWIEPGLQGAIGKQIAGYFDISAVLVSRTNVAVVDGNTVKTQVRTLKTFPEARFSWLKDRSGQLPPDFQVDFETDYVRMHELIYGKLASLPQSSETVVKAVVADTVAEAVAETAPEPVAAPEPTPSPDLAESPVPDLVMTVEEEPVSEVAVEIQPEPEIPSPAFGQTGPAEASEQPCVECGVAVTGDQVDLSNIRFRKVLCREHFLAAKRK